MPVLSVNRQPECIAETESTAAGIPLHGSRIPHLEYIKYPIYC
jgi:hypothetical protein